MKKTLTLSIALILVAGLISLAKTTDIGTNVSVSQATDYAEDRNVVQSDNIYWLVHESQYDFFRSYYDSGGTNQEAYKSSHTFDTWQDNPTGMVYYNCTVAIYPQVLILECM